MELSSFLLMVLSSVVATWGDQQAVAAKAASLAEGAAGAVASFNPGYFWMFTNCITSALFVLIMRKRIKLTNFKDFDTMFYNNVLALPILLLFSFCVEDWSSVNLTNNFSNDSLTAMIISGVASVGISYCSGWCVRVTSSTTYSMVGALNKLPIALSGLIFFDAQETSYLFSPFLLVSYQVLFMLLPNKRSNKPNLYVNENLRGCNLFFFLVYFIL